MAPLSRRNFFVGMAISLTAFGGIQGWRILALQLNEYFRRPEAARHIGKQLLVTGGNFNVPSDSVADVERAHLHDMRQGNIQIIDGWIYSQSEIDTCVYLASSSQMHEIKNHAG